MPTHHHGVSSRLKTPDANVRGGTSSTAQKDKGTLCPSAPLTRSASRASVKDDGPINSAKSRSKKRPSLPGADISMWTRFGIKNGTPVFMRWERASLSTDRECVTMYYESFSREELRSPPDLSGDSQLEEGDIYINTVDDAMTCNGKQLLGKARADT
ncbi:hypothetical protein LXA43DRAFT_1098539 [Ganoderma leucocontextum]|nr:hypothetical protein LXA43DRAFT_1098539 [Ganoderma leucocontextum]